MRMLLMAICPLVLLLTFAVIMPLIFISSFLKSLPSDLRQKILANTSFWDRYAFWFRFMFQNQIEAIDMLCEKMER